jgi:hypothetical protein
VTGANALELVWRRDKIRVRGWSRSPGLLARSLVAVPNDCGPGLKKK